MGVRTESSEEADKTLKQSAAYLEAMAKGKRRVVYVCDQGAERSVKYSSLAKDRGETNSDYMREGMWGFSGSLSRGKIKEKLLAEHANDHLRVIIDGQSHLQDFIMALLSSGISYEQTTSAKLKQEAISLGQDPNSYE